MRNFRFLLASALLMLSLGAWAGNRYCEGITTRTNNINCSYADRMEWTSNSANTMWLFKFGSEEDCVAADLTDVTALKFTLSEFIDKTAAQTASDANYWIRVWLLDSSGNKIKEINFKSNGAKTVNLSTEGENAITDENRADIKSIIIGGYSQDKVATGSVIVSYIKLMNGETVKYTTEAPVSRGNGNPNIAYNTDVFAWSEATANTMQLFSIEAGLLAKYSKLHLTTANLWGYDADSKAPKYRVLFLNGDTKVYEATYDAAGVQEIDLYSVMTDDQIASITEIAFGGANSTKGTVQIHPSDVYLVETQEVLKVEKVINSSSNATTPFEWHVNEGKTLSTISNNLGNTEGGVIFGYADNNDANHGYFDLAGYNKVVFDITSIADSKTIRLLAATDAGTVYTHDFYSTGLKEADDIDIQKCVSIKSGAGASTHHSLNSITFYRSFDATSTTEWDLAYDMEETTFDYPRYFTVGQSSTVCLPFALTVEQANEAGEFYELAELSGDDLGFDRVSEPAAYTPYLFVPAKNYPFKGITTSLKKVNTSSLDVTKGTATFKGVLQHTDNLAKSGYTLYGYNAANGEFVLVGTGVSINAFRAYIAVPEGGAAPARRLGVSIRKTPTAVEKVESTKIGGSAKYLRNGQLVIIRDGVEYNAQGQVVR